MRSPALRNRAATLAAAISTLGILFGLLVPIYSDEVGWRMQARSAIDGGVDRFLAEACGPNTLAHPPFFIVPLRYFSGYANLAFADPLFIRLAGVACALAWLAMLWMLIGNVSRSARERSALSLIAFGLSAFGVLPLMLVINRPEQPLLCAISLALLVTLRGWGADARETSHAQAVGAAATVVFAAAVALGYHLKGIVYAPIFVLCAVSSSRGINGRWARWIGAATILALTAIALPYWIDRFKCPADPVLAAKLAKENLASAFFTGGSLVDKLSLAAQGANPMTYVRLSMPAPEYMSQWLPAHIVTDVNAKIWRKILNAGWVASMVLGAFSFVVAAVRAWRARSLDLRAVAPLLLWSISTFWGITQLNKNSYEAALALPVTIMAIVLAIRAAAYGDGALRWIERLGFIVVAMAAISSAAVVTSYAKPLLVASRQHGYVDGQPYSLSPYGFDHVRNQIIATGRLCGIDPGQGTHALLVDDVTYFPYMATWRPLHRTGVLSDWNGSITDPAAYLRSKGSSGIVLGCAYLPPELRKMARRNGQFCCVGASSL